MGRLFIIMVCALIPSAHGLPLERHDGPESSEKSFRELIIKNQGEDSRLTRLAVTRALSDEVKKLADRILARQKQTLTDWGANVPEQSRLARNETVSSHIVTLERMTGRDFDESFLSLMSLHHEDALKMISTGKQDVLTKKLKKEIVEEIKLLDDLDKKNHQSK